VSDSGELQPGGAGLPVAPAPVPASVTQLEKAVAVVLRIGVTTSCLVIAAGSVLTLAAASTRSGARRSLAQVRRGALHPSGLPFPHTVAGALHATLHGNGLGLVVLGVLLLIATPVIRVAVGLGAFSLQRDRAFVFITATVLGVLLASFALG